MTSPCWVKNMFSYLFQAKYQEQIEQETKRHAEETRQREEEMRKRLREAEAEKLRTLLEEARQSVKSFE